MRTILPSFAYEENLVTEDDPPKPAIPEGVSALPLLQMAYRGQVQLTPQQMRAAIEALPFESPKQSATVIATMDGKTFAEALERCLERSSGPLRLNGPTTIEHELPASELKKPFQRNYRRF